MMTMKRQRGGNLGVTVEVSIVLALASRFLRPESRENLLHLLFQPSFGEC